MEMEALKRQALSRRNAINEEPADKRIRWTCEMCQHDFVSERVFMNHKCKERERFEELKTPIGQAAYQFYSEWMKLNKRSIPPIETFSHSTFYTTFIKFSRHVKKINMPNPSAFIKAMVENGKVQPSLWCRDNVYALYLQGYDKIVDPAEQFMTSLDFTHDLANEMKVMPGQVFEKLGVDEILKFVQRRKLSPWFLVSSKAFREYMNSRNDFDKSRLENSVQVGAMIMRIQNSDEAIENFKLFGDVCKQEGL